MKIYHGEVKTAILADSDHTAESLVAGVSKAIAELGGSVDVGRNFGDAPAIIMVALPDGATTAPGALIPGVEFHPVHAQQVQMVEDQGIGSQG